MPSRFRKFTEHRWMPNFHLILWEHLKETYPNLPKWSYPQLRYNGWWLAAGPRGYIQLRHQDGTVQNFLMNVGGQAMPHMSAVWGRLLGIDFSNNSIEDLDAFYAFAKGHFGNIQNVTITQNANHTVTMAVSWTAMQQLFDQVQPTELDNTQPDPRITTSEYFVKEILNHNNRGTHYFTFTPR